MEMDRIFEADIITVQQYEEVLVCQWRYFLLVIKYYWCDKIALVLNIIK